MSKITDICALEILDSRGNPTIKVKVETEYGGQGSAMVPSGASTGALEAWELRDQSAKTLSSEVKNHWYGQKGVSVAVNNVNTKIAKVLVGMEVTKQRLIDQTMIELDGTNNKSNLGANAILGVSLAVAKAAADELDLPLYRYIGGVNARTLPLPMLNVINGGDHASNTLDFQEFMIIPVGAHSFTEALHMANHTFHTLAALLKKAHHGTQVGDEGGFAPNLKSHEDALDFLVRAIKEAGYVPATSGEKAIAIALDAAASEYYNRETKQYTFKKALAANLVSATSKGSNQAIFTSSEMIKYLADLTIKYPILSIEDGLAEDDWEGFISLQKTIGHQIQTVGDDLFVTNAKILAKGIRRRAANAILIKLNQIGSLTETLDTIEMAQKAGFGTVVSHRSGETCDTTIADLAVALNTGQIKTGSLSRSDRISKYNRLLEIENELGKESKFNENIFYNIKHS